MAIQMSREDGIRYLIEFAFYDAIEEYNSRFVGDSGKDYEDTHPFEKPILASRAILIHDRLFEFLSEPYTVSGFVSAFNSVFSEFKDVRGNDIDFTITNDDVNDFSQHFRDSYRSGHLPLSPYDVNYRDRSAMRNCEVRYLNLNANNVPAGMTIRDLELYDRAADGSLVRKHDAIAYGVASMLPVEDLRNTRNGEAYVNVRDMSLESVEDACGFSRLRPYMKRDEYNSLVEGVREAYGQLVNDSDYDYRRLGYVAGYPGNYRDLSDVEFDENDEYSAEDARNRYYRNLDVAVERGIRIISELKNRGYTYNIVSGKRPGQIDVHIPEENVTIRVFDQPQDINMVGRTYDRNTAMTRFVSVDFDRPNGGAVFDTLPEDYIGDIDVFMTRRIRSRNSIQASFDLDAKPFVDTVLYTLGQAPLDDEGYIAGTNPNSRQEMYRYTLDGGVLEVRSSGVSVSSFKPKDGTSSESYTLLGHTDPVPRDPVSVVGLQAGGYVISDEPVNGARTLPTTVRGDVIIRSTSNRSYSRLNFWSDTNRPHFSERYIATAVSTARSNFESQVNLPEVFEAARAEAEAAIAEGRDPITNDYPDVILHGENPDSRTEILNLRRVYYSVITDAVYDALNRASDSPRPYDVHYGLKSPEYIEGNDFDQALVRTSLRRIDEKRDIEAKLAGDIEYGENDTVESLTARLDELDGQIAQIVGDNHGSYIRDAYDVNDDSVPSVDDVLEFVSGHLNSMMDAKIGMVLDSDGRAVRYDRMDGANVVLRYGADDSVTGYYRYPEVVRDADGNEVRMSTGRRTLKASVASMEYDEASGEFVPVFNYSGVDLSDRDSVTAFESAGNDFSDSIVISSPNNISHFMTGNGFRLNQEDFGNALRTVELNADGTYVSNIMFYNDVFDAPGDMSFTPDNSFRDSLIRFGQPNRVGDYSRMVYDRASGELDISVKPDYEESTEYPGIYVNHTYTYKELRDRVLGGNDILNDVNASAEDRIAQARANYMYDMLETVRETLVSGMTSLVVLDDNGNPSNVTSVSAEDDIDIQIDDNGVIQYRFVRNGYGDATKDEIVTGTIGQIFVPDYYVDDNGSLAMGLTESAFAGSDQTYFAFGYSAYAVDQNQNAGSFFERLRVESFDEELKRNIRHDIRNDISQVTAVYGVGSSTSLNGVYKHSRTVERLPVSFESTWARQGLSDDIIRARVTDLRNKIVYRGDFKDNANILTASRYDGIMRDDRSNDAMAVAGNESLTHISHEGRYYVDSVALGGGKNQTDVHVCNSGVVIEQLDDGTFRLVPVEHVWVDDDPSKGVTPEAKCAIHALSINDFIEFDASNRQQMTFSNNKHCVAIDEKPARIAYTTFAGFEQNDGIVVSLDYANSHFVPDQESSGELRSLIVGDKLSDGHGNKGVITAVIDPNAYRRETLLRVRDEYVAHTGVSANAVNSSDLRDFIINETDSLNLEFAVKYPLHDELLSAYREIERARGVAAIAAESDPDRQAEMQSELDERLANVDDAELNRWLGLGSNANAYRDYVLDHGVRDFGEQYRLYYAENKPIDYATCEFFRNNPSLDLVMSPHSFQSRLNGGNFREAFANIERRRHEAEEAGVEYEPQNLVLANGEVVPEGIAEIVIMLTDKTADLKTNPDNACHSGWQLSQILNSLGMDQFLLSTYGNNTSAFLSFREMLRTVGGYDITPDGVPVDHLLADGERDSRVLDIYDETHYIKESVAKDGTRSVSSKVSRSSYEASVMDFLNKDGGYIELPFKLDWPDLSGALGIDDEGYTPNSIPECGGIGAPRWHLPVMSIKERQGQELLDNEIKNHDYTTAYMRICDGAISYYMADNAAYTILQRHGYDDADMRAEFVRDYLVSDGADPSVIEAYDSYRTAVDALIDTGDMVSAKKMDEQALGVLRGIGYDSDEMRDNYLSAHEREFDSVVGRGSKKMTERDQYRMEIRKRDAGKSTSQDAFSRLAREAAESFRTKNNIVRTKLMRATIENSGTSIWTADPRNAIDEVHLGANFANKHGIKDGDYLAIGRAPELIESNMRAFRVTVDPNLTGVSVNPEVAKMIAGDFDGDTVSVCKPGSKRGEYEIIDKFNVVKEFINCRDSREHHFTVGNETDLTCARYFNPEYDARLRGIEERFVKHFDELCEAQGVYHDPEVDEELQNIAKEYSDAITDGFAMECGVRGLSFESPGAFAESVYECGIEPGAKGSIGNLGKLMRNAGIHVDGNMSEYISVDENGKPRFDNLVMEEHTLQSYADEMSTQKAVGLKTYATGVVGKFMMYFESAYPDLKYEAHALAQPLYQMALDWKHDGEVAITQSRVLSPLTDALTSGRVYTCSFDDVTGVPLPDSWRPVKTDEGKDAYYTDAASWVKQLHMMYASVEKDVVSDKVWKRVEEGAMVYGDTIPKSVGLDHAHGVMDRVMSHTGYSYDELARDAADEANVTDGKLHISCTLPDIRDVTLVVSPQRIMDTIHEDKDGNKSCDFMPEYGEVKYSGLNEAASFSTYFMREFFGQVRDTTKPNQREDFKQNFVPFVQDVLAVTKTWANGEVTDDQKAAVTGIRDLLFTGKNAEGRYVVGGSWNDTMSDYCSRIGLKSSDFDGLRSSLEKAGALSEETFVALSRRSEMFSSPMIRSAYGETFAPIYDAMKSGENLYGTFDVNYADKRVRSAMQKFVEGVDVTSSSYIAQRAVDLNATFGVAEYSKKDVPTIRLETKATHEVVDHANDVVYSEVTTTAPTIKSVDEIMPDTKPMSGMDMLAMLGANSRQAVVAVPATVGTAAEACVDGNGNELNVERDTARLMDNLKDRRGAYEQQQADESVSHEVMNTLIEDPVLAGSAQKEHGGHGGNGDAGDSGPH